MIFFARVCRSILGNVDVAHSTNSCDDCSSSFACELGTQSANGLRDRHCNGSRPGLDVCSKVCSKSGTHGVQMEKHLRCVRGLGDEHCIARLPGLEASPQSSPHGVHMQKFAVSRPRSLKGDAAQGSASRSGYEGYRQSGLHGVHMQNSSGPGTRRNKRGGDAGADASRERGESGDPPSLDQSPGFSLCCSAPTGETSPPSNFAHTASPASSSWSVERAASNSALYCRPATTWRSHLCARSARDS